MNIPTSPTCNQLFDEELGQPIFMESDPSWRHGEYRTEVWKRESDNTFWKAVYQVSGDGETNGLREGNAKITQVEPYEKTVTLYRSIPR